MASANPSIRDFFPPLWVSVFLVVAMFIWFLVQLKEMLVLLVVGYSVAYVIHPIVSQASRRGMSRSVAILLVMALAFITLSVMVLTVLPTLLEEAALLAQNFPSYIASVKDLLRNLPQLAQNYLPSSIASKLRFESVVDAIPAVNGPAIAAIFKAVASTLVQGYSITLTVVNLTLLPFIVFYLAEAMPRLHRWCMSLIPTRIRPEVRQLAFEIDELLRAFIKGQLIVGSILFCLYCLGLSIIGIKLWFLLAVISGFGQIVPYLGFATGIVLSSIMAVVTFGEFTPVLMVWGLYATIQVLEGFVITPRIVGESVGMSPLEIIIALFAGGTLFGLLGIFLAVPAAAATKVLLRHSFGKLMDRLEVAQ